MARKQCQHNRERHCEGCYKRSQHERYCGFRIGLTAQLVAEYWSLRAHWQGRWLILTDLLHLTTYVKTMRLYLIPKNNPEFERSKYQYDVDKETVTLRVEGEAGSAIGVINWYPVHGTSMNNWNTLISGYIIILLTLIFSEITKVMPCTFGSAIWMVTIHYLDLESSWPSLVTQMRVTSLQTRVVLFASMELHVTCYTAHAKAIFI